MKKSSTGKIIVFGVSLTKKPIHEISIDNTVWKIGKKFMGFHSVPSGFHILSIESSNESPLILHVPENGVTIIKIEPNFSMAHMSKSDTMFPHLNDIGRGSEIESAMVKYQIENFDIWRKNTDCIDREIVEGVLATPKNHEYQFPDVKGFSSNFFKNFKGAELTKNKLDLTNLMNHLIYFETRFCDEIKDADVVYALGDKEKTVRLFKMKKDKAEVLIRKIENDFEQKLDIEYTQTKKKGKKHLIREK